ncbi:MAG: DUF72 domain-containing protein [Saprospiraceae bacterium]
MKFGKLPDVSNVDFSLPCDMPGTREALKKRQRQGDKVHFYMGGTGWAVKEWVGSLFPADAKQKDYLKHYSRQFNTVEMNTTHYRIPTAEMVERWKTESEADFKFCPKIPQTISHSANLGVNTGLIEQFAEAIEGLGEKLGCCFMQLPPYFGADRLAILEAFLKVFPLHIPLAVEVRHESWFDNVKHANKLFDLLEKYDTSSVITDVAGRRDVLHMRLTTNTAMIRFVGNGLHPTDFTRLNDWMWRIDSWYEQGLEKVYFFLHEPEETQVPEAAAYLLKILKPFPRYQIRGPKIQQENTGTQISLF